MANEGLIIDVDYNITKAEAKSRKLNREFDISKQKAENIKKEIQALNDEIDRSKMKEQEYTSEAERLRNRANQYIKGNLQLTDEQVKNEKQRREELEKLIDKEQAHQRSKEKRLSSQNLALKKQNAETANIGDKISLNVKKQSKFSQAFQKSTKSADRFGHRLKSLIASALFFSLVTKAFTALRNEFGKLITETGTKTAKLVKQLNGNLAVLGRTLYEGARPYIEWILQALVKMVNILTHGLAKILGKNVNEMKKLAKQTKKTGEEAKKATASFDTLQTIDTTPSGDSKTNFDALNDNLDKETAILMAIVSGALLVLGVILTFTGANIPLGLGLISAGAVGLASSISAMWGTIPQKTKDTITGILAIGGALFILLGLVLILTGAGIPLGIGLILLGAGLLYGSYELTPGDDFKEKIKNLWSNVKSITQNFLDWWKEKVINKVFGKGMSDSLQDMYDSFINLYEDIADFLMGVFAGDWKKIWKSLGNIAVDVWNLIIARINQTIQFFLGGGSKLISFLGKIFEKDWKLDVNWAKIPKVPRLATGAILPGGSPMLAWVNDQPKGQPYVEGSIENIAAAFEKYLGDRGFGNQNITIEAKGNWAQFIKWMNLEIKKENNRASIWG